MPRLDHLTVIAPSLAEGIAHIRDCLGVDIPFGRKHPHMGTHNHLLVLGDSIYLEVIATDETAPVPGHPRWFALGDPASVRQAWDEGRRLRGWVARTDHFHDHMTRHGAIYGEGREFGSANGSYYFAIPPDGSLPMNGLAPSLIDRQGKRPSMPIEADQGCRLKRFTIRHPDTAMLADLYQRLSVAGSPAIEHDTFFRYLAEIETPAGLKLLF